MKRLCLVFLIITVLLSACDPSQVLSITPTPVPTNTLYEMETPAPVPTDMTSPDPTSTDSPLVEPTDEPIDVIAPTDTPEPTESSENDGVVFEYEQYANLLPDDIWFGLETMIQEEGVNFERGWIDNQEDGSVVPNMVLTRDMQAGDRVVPLGVKYYWNGNEWVKPVVKLDRTSVEFIMGENPWGVEFNYANTAAMQRLAKAVYEQISQAVASSYSNQVDMYAVAHYNMTDGFWEQKKGPIERRTELNVNALEAQMGETGGWVSGKVGLPKEGMDLSQQVIVEFLFEDTEAFDTVIAQADTLDGHYVETMVDFAHHSAVAGDPTFEGFKAVKYVLKESPSGQVRVMINVDPDLVNFWDGYTNRYGATFSLEAAVDLVLGEAWISGLAGAFLGKMELGNDSAGGSRLSVNPFAWFPWQVNYQNVTTANPETIDQSSLDDNWYDSDVITVSP